MKSVRLRLLIWNISIVAVTLFAFQSLAHITIRTLLQTRMDRRSNEMAERTMQFFNENRTGPPRQPPPLPRDMPKSPREDKRRDMIRAFDLQGKPLPHPGPPSTDTARVWNLAGFQKAAAGQLNYTVVRDPEENNALVRILSRPLLRQGKQIGVIQVAMPYEEMQSLLSSLMLIFLILSPCALVLAGLGGIFLTDRALRPVRHIVQTAETIGSDDLSRRLPVVGADEFAKLASTMNGMLARIEVTVKELRQSLERERRLTSDASHELRTPLTAIRANATLMLEDDTLSAENRASLEAIDLAATLIQRQVEDLLLLARSDSGQLVPTYAEIDIHDLFTTAVKMVHREAQHAAIHLEVADDAHTMRGDPLQLQRLVINVLENALRYTPAAGSVRLSARRDAGAVVLSVTDTGEGIAPEHLAHLGERFYRVDASRARQHGGTGLGLAICKGILEAHHGRLQITSTPGHGTNVLMLLPDQPA